MQDLFFKQDLVKRSEIVRIISASVARNFYIAASQTGWRTAEPSRIDPEHPFLFEQLVYRAVNEQEISVQRGAELLQQSFDEVVSMCRLNEVCSMEYISSDTNVWIDFSVIQKTELPFEPVPAGGCHSPGAGRSFGRQ